MNKKISIAIVLAIVLLGTISVTAWYVYKIKFQKTLEGNQCVYSEDNHLTCGKSWTILSLGKTYELTKNKSFSFPKGEGDKFISLVNSDKSEIYFLYLIPGTYELSANTSSEAIGHLYMER